ncbi:MAG: hypothetical protein B7Z68_00405 [Acidobacteria bacterium 21-70-11]|nr:MAG: hypothetical protein B7Z68_00405 [Acidobacteria bacterium 21-70-11]
MKLNQELVRDVFSYDPDEQGALRWKKNLGGRAKEGNIAGSVCRCPGKLYGSRYVNLHTISYPVAHIVWLYHHGELPKGRLQYIDKNPENCRLENLRIKKTEKNYADFKKQNRERMRLVRAKSLGKELSDQVISRKMKDQYGINLEQYQLMLEKQNGVCAICGNPETTKWRDRTLRLSIDHCHASNKVRGLLCMHCNSAIGRFFDDTERLKSAISYLEKHQDQTEISGR